MENKSITTDIKESLRRIRHNIGEAAAAVSRDPSEISLIAVTKTVKPEHVNIAVWDGVKILGENRAQELLEKYPHYDKEGCDIHFIGRLQSNKVKYIIDKVGMIQSLDSLKLAVEIDKQAKKISKVMKTLVEVNIGEEESKSGIKAHELEEFLCKIATLSNIKVAGLMAIPPVYSSDFPNENYFAKMQQIFVDIRGKKIDNINMDILSMGMTDDYTVAIKHGSNMVRLGTAIFGKRY